MVLTTFVQQLISSMVAVLILAVIFLVTYSLKSMSQMKQEVIKKDYIAKNLKEGSTVLFSNGIKGVVQSIYEEEVVVAVNDQMTLTILKDGIYEII